MMNNTYLGSVFLNALKKPNVNKRGSPELSRKPRENDYGVMVTMDSKLNLRIWGANSAQGMTIHDQQNLWPELRLQ